MIQEATRLPGGGFGVRSISQWAEMSLNNPQMAIAADGTVTVDWAQMNGTISTVKAVTREPGGAFETPVDLSQGGQNAYENAIAIGPDGVATAAWARSNGTRR